MNKDIRYINDVARIKLKWRIKKVRIAFAAFLLKVAARSDSEMVERFAFDYTAANSEAFDNHCWQKTRSAAYKGAFYE